MEKEKTEMEEMDKINQEKGKNKNNQQDPQIAKGNMKEALPHNQKEIEIQNQKELREEQKQQKVSEDNTKEAVPQKQRGREEQNRNMATKISKRGTSAPPKQTYKPTIAIFGVDKPSPTNEEVRKEVVGKKNEERQVVDTMITSTSSNPIQNKNQEQQIQVSSEKQSIEILTKDHNATQVVLSPNDKEKLHSNTQWITERKKKTRPVKQLFIGDKEDITQNRFVNLEVEGDKPSQQKNVHTSEGATKESTQNKEPPDDEWAENTTSEEEESNGSSDEEAEILIKTLGGKGRDSKEAKKAIADLCMKEGLSPRANKDTGQKQKARGNTSTKAQKSTSQKTSNIPIND
ncbi:uncharacterized protein LOC132639297 [Lycium barbarum]|uniref:uncharacterized protein LOC132639297 n=1 Tax=Lycium barbarum TaxID=112863 RepID=UPI00293E5FC9|nr:uncharacterized protein LOC132639297 [Lycium barbarum]